MENGGGRDGGVEVLQIDEAYDFCAPRFFDFTNEETEEEITRTELWFETSLSYAPSPFMPRIREGRSIQIDSLCDFGDIDQEQKVEVPTKDSHQNDPMPGIDNTTRNYQPELVTYTEVKSKQDQIVDNGKFSFEFVSEVKPCQTNILPQHETSSSSLALTNTLRKEEVPSFEFPVAPPSGGAPVAASAACTSKAHRSPTNMVAHSTVKNHVSVETCTPRALRIPGKVAPSSSKNVTAKRIASLIRQPSALKPKTKSPIQSSKSTKEKNVKKCPISLAAKNSMVNEIAQENQAVKRQKLDDGRSRQIHNVKNRVLHHKSRVGLTGGTDIFSSGANSFQEGKSLQKEVPPFISAAEMVNKFQSGTRDLDIFWNRSLSHDDTASVIQRRPKLTLTRPKDPELQTAHRVRAVRIKSSAVLEEEMLAKIPKFKARPLNKKILEAPKFPALPRSIPQPPVFQEFHLKTMERANQHVETSSVVSSLDTSVQNQVKTLKLTEPRPPHLETSLRARPPKIRSSQELELEELEKIPKFKARPLNKKILESKGEIGLSCNPKLQITIPQEFHFATDDRLGPPATVVELFDKISLHSESSNHDKKEVPRITIPNPFHLHTEERGLEKERQFSEQILQKELEEERARVQKANPYPYTTDYPVMPPKPEPKQCTKPEAFQLECLVRHEEEMQRNLEEKERMEREEAQRRIFRAQPIIKDDPLPVPERERKPLTEVQEFVLHADHRAVQRMEFDKKDLQKDIIRACEALVTVEHRHVEIGTKLSEACYKYGGENHASGAILAKAATLYGGALRKIEKEHEDLGTFLSSQIMDPLKAMVTGAPLENTHNIFKEYRRMRHEAETLVAEVTRRQSRVRETPTLENTAKLQSSEAKLCQLKENMTLLGREAAAALVAVELQQQRQTFQRLAAMVEAEKTFHLRVASILDDVEAEMITEKQRKESAPSVSFRKHSEKALYFLAEAIYQFNATSEKELSLVVGDYVVVRQVSPSGWAEGECRGRAGWFPSEYVERRPDKVFSQVD